MKTIAPPFPDVGWNLTHPVAIAIIPLKKRRIKYDIVLNVNFKDSLIRSAFVLFVPMLLLFDTSLIIYITPVIFYLFVSALTKFCIVKYVWHRYIKHEPTPKPSNYGKNPNYPEESI